MSDTPKGVIALLIRPDGYVAGVGTDFEQVGYGGFTTREAQEYRARRMMEMDFVKSFAGPDIASVMDGYDCANVVRDLRSKKGFREYVHAVGYEDDGND